MWEYREEYIEKQDLTEALNFYSKEGWEAFQIEKDVVQRESYGDKRAEINYNVYLKRRVE